jgi:hypothetical protein
MTGPTGPNEVYYGSGNPAALLGNNDAIYVNDQQGDIHFKQAGVWTLRGANAWYLQGKALTAAVIAPSDGDILVYDASLLSGVGGWKVAAPSGGSSSFAGMDDETRARLNLAILL